MRHNIFNRKADIAMEFTYESYMAMIKDLDNMGYQFADYRTWRDSGKTVILRHDVDYSLQRAVAFSDIEKGLGVQSTYFILLSTDFYNVCSVKSRRCIDHIINNGGNIGLHFDEMQYDIQTEEELKKYVQRDAERLSDIIGIKTDIVSMHRPSKKFLSKDMEFHCVINSYSKTYFQEMKYLSDSRRHWREDVDEIIRQGTFKRLHILIHPFWYFPKLEKDIKQTLREAIFNASLEYYDNLKENFKNLENEITRDEIRKLLWSDK